MNDCSCIAELYDEYSRFLLLPEWLSYGAKFGQDCETCDSVNPWGRIAREHVTTSLRRAVQTLEKKTGCELCPQQKTLLVNPDECPIQLDVPIWYFGKRVEVQTQQDTIHWGYRDACDEPYICDDLNNLGQIIITDIPDEWEGDLDHVEFEYPDYLVTRQCLPRPRFTYQCCSGEKVEPHRCAEQYECPERCQLLISETLTTPEPGYCQTFINNCDALTIPYTIGQRLMMWRSDNTFVWVWYTGDSEFSTYIIYDLTQFVAVSTPYIVATWEKYQLINPNYNMGLVTAKKACDAQPEFLDDIQTTFFEIQEPLEIIDVCSCDTCNICRCNCQEDDETCPHETPAVQTLYTYELDTETGELCLHLKSTCTCPTPHRIKIYYGVKPEIDADIQLAIILRAFLWSSQHIKCGCADYDEQIEWWLEVEPGISTEAFSSPRKYPYGKTRAGAELLRLFDAWTTEKVREGIKHAPAGAFTSRAIRKIRPGDRPRRINPRDTN